MNINPENRRQSSSEETHDLDQKKIEQTSSEETEMDSDSDIVEIPVVRSYVVVSDSTALYSVILLSNLSFLVEAQRYRHGERLHQLQHHPQCHPGDVRGHHGGGGQARLP